MLAAAALLVVWAAAGTTQDPAERLARDAAQAESELAEFRRRLEALFDEYAGRPIDPTAPRWSLYLGMHPEA